MLHRPSASSVIATAALVLALGGTAFGGAKTLLTGQDVKNGSLTGRDIRDGSLRAADIRSADLRLLNPVSDQAGAGEGPAGPRGPKGDTGAPAALPSVSATGPDVAGYLDRTPLVSSALPAAGAWLLLGRFEVTNTGASTDYLNCAFQVGAVQAGASGAQVDPGATSSASPITVLTIDDPEPVSLMCEGGGVTTFDIAGVRMTAVKLA